MYMHMVYAQTDRILILLYMFSGKCRFFSFHSLFHFIMKYEQVIDLAIILCTCDSLCAVTVPDETVHMQSKTVSLHMFYYVSDSIRSSSILYRLCLSHKSCFPFWPNSVWGIFFGFVFFTHNLNFSLQPMRGCSHTVDIFHSLWWHDKEAVSTSEIKKTEGLSIYSTFSGLHVTIMMKAPTTIFSIIPFNTPLTTNH